MPIARPAAQTNDYLRMFAPQDIAAIYLHL